MEPMIATAAVDTGVIAVREIARAVAVLCGIIYLKDVLLTGKEFANTPLGQLWEGLKLRPLGWLAILASIGYGWHFVQVWMSDWTFTDNIASVQSLFVASGVALTLFLSLRIAGAYKTRAREIQVRRKRRRDEASGYSGVSSR